VLKELGFTLDQIALALNDQLGVAELQAMFQRKRREVEQQLRREQARLTRLDARLQQLEREGQVRPYDVVLKPLPLQTVASCNVIIPTIEELDERRAACFADIRAWMQAQQLTASGPSFAIYANPDYCDCAIALELAVPVASSLAVEQACAPAASIALRSTPAVPLAATLLHHGSREALLDTSVAIGTWIATRDYHIAGPCREVYFQDMAGSEAIIEVQFAVQPATTEAALLCAEQQ
jgi:DNA-binding transcriptional MerR regulator